MAGAVDIANLALSGITALAATYLAFVALKHAAKPRIIIVAQSPTPGTLRLRETLDHLIFDVINVGHWYVSPMARDITVEIHVETNVVKWAQIRKGGVGGPIDCRADADDSARPLILTSNPFTLFHREKAKFSLDLNLFSGGGNGAIGVLVRAWSVDGATFFEDFRVQLESRPI